MEQSSKFVLRCVELKTEMVLGIWLQWRWNIILTTS